MTRRRVTLSDGRYIIAGFDRPFGTWYAQLYGEGMSHHDAPLAAIGYHPAEQAIAKADRPDIKIGPYPVTTVEDLLACMRREWEVQLARSEVT